MADAIVMDAIRKYKSILDQENDDKILLRVLRKLERMNMSLEILQETGIGKTVNKLNKRNGEVKSLSSRIVSQWKELVSKKNDYVNNCKTEMPVKDTRSQHSGGHSNKDYNSVNNAKQSSKVPSTPVKRKEMVDVEDGRSSVKRQKCETSTARRSSSTDEEINSALSFEACLGMSDTNHKIKKRSAKPGSSSSSSSTVRCRESTKPSVEKTEEPKHTTGDRIKQKTKTTSSNIPVLLEKPVDIPLPVLTLPEIQANYRPIRSHFIIDDTSTNQRKRQIDKDDTYFMSSRHNRTQVFSGRKLHVVSELTSLKDSCLRVLMDNPRLLLEEHREDYIWFDILEPAIARLSPEELYQLEQNHHKLTADTNGLWKLHCQREFKTCITRKEESWQELYWRLTREREIKLKSITENITASMAKSVPVRQTKLAYVDCTAKPPRAVARQQAKFGTGRGGPEATKSLSKKATLINTITANVSRNTSEVVPAPSSSSSSSRSSSSTQNPPKPVKKVAPLMQKTLKFLKNRFRR
ncbi:hypothetical protein CHUAL_000532 [Chamberlinius hualienensis]